jgi:hypothetical protein
LKIKLNVAIKNNPYLLPFTDEVINIIIEHEVYTFLNCFSKYHHISITLEDQYKIAFVTDWGTFVWVIMHFRVKNEPPYQKVVTKAFCKYIDVFMKIFLDDFIIFSYMSNHIKKFRKCFLKCIKYGISLNPKKCAFMVCLGTILGFIISKEGKTHNPKKIEAMLKMLIRKTLQEIQVFNGMAQFCQCFINFFASIMAPITKLLRKIEAFEWIVECQAVWGDIKNQYIQAPILIGPNYELEFHVHIDASQLVVGVILVENLTSKIDQHVMYSSILLNYVERNYFIMEREALAMVYALHKFRHYMLGNRFTFYVNHMVLMYLVNKP